MHTLTLGFNTPAASVDFEQCVLLPLMITLLCKVNTMVEQGSVCTDAIFLLTTALFIVSFTFL